MSAFGCRNQRLWLHSLSQDIAERRASSQRSRRGEEADSKMGRRSGRVCLFSASAESALMRNRCIRAVSRDFSEDRCFSDGEDDERVFAWCSSASKVRFRRDETVVLKIASPTDLARSSRRLSVRPARSFAPRRPYETSSSSIPVVPRSPSSPPAIASCVPAQLGANAFHA